MILFIDTARSPAYLVLGEVGSLLGEGWVELEGVSSDQLAQAVVDLFDRCSIIPAQISRIGVGMGPGSYTGMRVGIAFAKGFHLATGCELVGVVSLHRYRPWEPCSFLSLVDARAGGVYLQRGRCDGTSVVWEAEPKRASIEELIAETTEVDGLLSPDQALIEQRMGWGRWLPLAEAPLYLLEQVALGGPLVPYYLSLGV